MKYIPLTRGKSAIVSDDDFEEIAKRKWCFSGNGYAITHTVNRRKEFMHRVIMKADPGQLIDHINRDSLDNRRENLRFSNKSLNSHNAGAHKNSKSGIRGVYRAKGLWEASLKINYKNVYRKLFKTLEEAIKGRKQAEAEFLKFSL